MMLRIRLEPGDLVSTGGGWFRLWDHREVEMKRGSAVGVEVVPADRRPGVVMLHPETYRRVWPMAATKEVDRAP
jgi:hypothetical protein